MPEATDQPPPDEVAPLLRMAFEEFGDSAATMRVSAPVSAKGSGTVGGRNWNPPSVEELQKVLPQYEISAFIARGGMGAVYKGQQKTLKRPVAIKVLPPEIEDGDAQFAARFKHEAQAMAQLSHPNIVAVHDAGETPDGLLYFVMEFIEGTDVAQLIASEGQLDPQRAIQITTAVCEALAFAHEEGIIHRDIKPSNIMLDRKGRVKVADFGLAKTVNVEQTLLTGSNMALGTPDFIAPEALIPGMKVDQRADIYAVGVMLYQMLTGHIPRGRFELPSGVVPQVDKGFDPIVDKAMQTDRDKRYSSATEMKTAVERVVTVKTHDESTYTPDRSLSDGGESTKSQKAHGGARAPLLIAALVVIGSGVFFAFRKPGSDAISPPSSSNVSHIPLDGLPDTEAPKTTAGAEVAKSSAPQISKSPPFPPGQWVRPFQQAADLHENWTNGGTTFVDGWITPDAGTNHAITLAAPNGRGKNWGVRALYRWQEKGLAALPLRRSGKAADNTVATYEFRVSDGSAGFRRCQANGIAMERNFTPLGEIAAVELTAGDEVLVEAFAIGGILYGRVNGRLFQVASDNVLEEGGFEASATQMSYRDIEFINLDGLSEAEALKAAGINTASPTSSKNAH